MSNDMRFQMLLQLIVSVYLKFVILNSWSRRLCTCEFSIGLRHSNHNNRIISTSIIYLSLFWGTPIVATNNTNPEYRHLVFSILKKNEENNEIIIIPMTLGMSLSFSRQWQCVWNIMHRLSCFLVFACNIENTKCLCSEYILYFLTLSAGRCFWSEPRKTLNAAKMICP